MANMIVEDGKYVLSQEIVGSGSISKTLSTTNTFVDKDIKIVTTTPEGALGAGSGSSEASSDVGILGTATGSQPATGHYIKVEGDANVAVATSGWLDSGTDVDVSIADVYYPVVEATFTVDGPSVKTTATGEGYVGNSVTVGTVATGVQTITGGALSEGAKSTAITSDGNYNGSSYDTSDKVKFESSETAGVYKIHSDGSVTVDRAVVNKQVTSAGYFTQDSSAVSAIAADSITVTAPDHDYYIKKSSLSASTATSSNVQQTITVYEGYYPSDRTITIEAMTEVTPTTSLANTGMSHYFTSGTSSSNDVSITPQYSNTAGYVSAHTDTNNGGIEYFNIIEQTVTETTTTVSGTTATRGTRTESVGWNETAETLDVATFTNAAETGVTYVDISGTTAAPVLVSNDYLYINAGWTDAVKISLAKLVPDGSDVKGHSEYILSGHTAYDDDGVLVTGSIPTYAGAYTVDT